MRKEGLDTSSDFELGRALGEGDESALAGLYDRHMPAIYDFLARFLRDRTAAEDVAQLTFIRAWESRDTLREPGRVKSWLFTIAHNLATNHYTRIRRTESIEDQFDLASPAAGPEGEAESREMANLVWAAAASLEPRQYAVLDLSVRRDLPTGEIAQILGVPAGHAAVLVSRAKGALGNAVRYLLVAQRRDHCPRLADLVPAGITSLTPEQRASVDRHMRRCPECQGLARKLTMPAELFGALVGLPLPASLRHDRRDFVLVGSRHQRQELGRRPAAEGPRRRRTRGSRPSRRTLLRRAALAATALLLLGIAGGLYVHLARLPNPAVAAGFDRLRPGGIPSPPAATAAPDIESPNPGSQVGAAAGGSTAPPSGQTSGGGGSSSAPPSASSPAAPVPGAPPPATSTPEPTSNPAPTPTPTPSASPSPAPQLTVTNVTLAAESPSSGGGCTQNPAGYSCDFVVSVKYQDPQPNSSIAGSVRATLSPPGLPAESRTVTFTLHPGPGTSAQTVTVSVLLTNLPCLEDSTAVAVIQQPNSISSSAIGFGRVCTPG